MASKTIMKNTSSTFYTIYVTCTVDNDYSTTQAKLSWSSYITFGNWYQWGVRLKTYVNGSEVGNKAQACTSTGQTVCSSSGTVYITKTASSQSISFSATSSSETVSGYGGVGSSYTGTASGTVTVAAGKQAPDAATSCTLTESTKDTTATFTWVASGTTLKPIENQEWAYQKDGGDWTYAKTGNGTTRSATFNLETNAQYRAAIQMENSVGGSSWTYSDYIYTTPPAPNVTGLNTGEYVYLTADCSSTKWYNSHVWQVSLNGGSSWSAVDGTGPTLKYTVDTSSTSQNVLRPQFRCAVKNTEGDQSAWTTCIPTYKIKAYLSVPSGSTCQGIYINDGMWSVVVKKAVMTLTIAGGGGYVEYNGIKYTSTCTFEAAVGDTITVFCGTVPSSATIYLNGAQVSTGLASTTYMYPVVGNATIDCSTSGSSASKRANVYITEE